MRPEPPVWRKLFDAVEAPAGRGLQEGVNRDDFLDAITLARRLQRGLGRRVEGISTMALHMLNLPARRDVRRAVAQLTRIERDLRGLSQDVRELRQELGANGDEP